VAWKTSSGAQDETEVLSPCIVRTCYGETTDVKCRKKLHISI
jgi:hypothetical protein